MVRKLKIGDLICTKNNEIHEVSFFDERNKEISVKHKSHFSDYKRIPLSEIFGAMKK